MQRVINYTDIFNFFLSQPIAVLKGGATEAEIVQELYAHFLFPLTYIRDKKHPFFISTVANLKAQGVTQKVKLIIIPIGYIKQFIA
jgi:hypothetical protein